MKITLQFIRGGSLKRKSNLSYIFPPRDYDAEEISGRNISKRSNIPEK